MVSAFSKVGDIEDEEDRDKISATAMAQYAKDVESKKKAGHSQAQKAYESKVSSLEARKRRKSTCFYLFFKPSKTSKVLKLFEEAEPAPQFLR